VSEIIHHTMKGLRLKYPKVSDVRRRELLRSRKVLLAEKD